MDKRDVIKQIKETVQEVLHISITDDEENIISGKYNYPVIYLYYVIEKLAKVYGETIYEIFEEDNYNILQVSALADAIIEVCDKAGKMVEVSL